jgi:hypothetical protein
MNIKPETLYRKCDEKEADCAGADEDTTFFLKEIEDVYCFSADELKEVLENAFNAGREIDKDQDVIYNDYEDYLHSLNIK